MRTLAGILRARPSRAGTVGQRWKETASEKMYRLLLEDREVLSTPVSGPQLLNLHGVKGK